MTDKELAEELANCPELISFDEEETSLEEAIKEIEDALDDSPYGEGWILRGKDLYYCEKEWTGSDDILIFGDEDALADEAISWWKNALEGDESAVNVEDAVREGFTNKTNERVKDDWLDAEIDMYQSSPEDALSTFQHLQDKYDEYEADTDALYDELYEIEDAWGEVKWVMKGLKKSKEKPERDATKRGEKLVVLLLAGESSKAQAVELMEALAELDEDDENYQQDLANLIATLNAAYDGVKKAYDKKEEEWQDKKEEAADWYRDDLPAEIASAVEEYTGQHIDLNYHGDMHAYLKYEHGFEDDYILENYFDGVDYYEYAEWIVQTNGAGHGLDSYDGEIHKACKLVWVHY